MKNLILLFLMIIFFAPVIAQKLTPKEIPPVVMTEFRKTHPFIKIVDWNKADKNFGASYNRDRKDFSIIYDSSGKFIKTQEEISLNMSPLAVSDYMKENHKRHKVKKVFKISDINDNITYLLKIKHLDLTFDSKGYFIKSIKN